MRARSPRSRLTRRAFLAGCAGALADGAALRAQHGRQLPLAPPPDVDWPSIRDRLHARYADLRRHFVFEYYPWYGADPFEHWNEDGRVPPDDLAASSVPLLGAYDSRSVDTLEQHARWIADAGVGAINVSWWGPDSFCDRAVPLLMDVMAAHDIRVAFHLEPYRSDRVQCFVDDVLYLVSEYGDKRAWDALLLLPDAGGIVGPVFKTFRTILPPGMGSCFRSSRLMPDSVPDEMWREQTDRLRQELGGTFPKVTLLADSLDAGRTAAGGFDGLAVYDNYVAPDQWPTIASWCRPMNLLFSFNVNPGADPMSPRGAADESCLAPQPFEPDIGAIVWSDEFDRERARLASQQRMYDTFTRTVQLQTESRSSNYRHGFFLVYVNSFNEWHEGHQFEPMKGRAELTPAEAALEYHNDNEGGYRLQYLRELMDLLA